jgi:hypothetical protein
MLNYLQENGLKFLHTEYCVEIDRLLAEIGAQAQLQQVLHVHPVTRAASSGQIGHQVGRLFCHVQRYQQVVNSLTKTAKLSNLDSVF